MNKNVGEENNNCVSGFLGKYLLEVFSWFSFAEENNSSVFQT